ncbi:hypothetical protein MRB53_038212 [Persea americana]|nr:hypothetical protein MRB53_038212 [Persea americana]
MLWSLCPVQLPPAASASSDLVPSSAPQTVAQAVASTQAASSSRTGAAALSSTAVSLVMVSETAMSLGSLVAVKRQASTRAVSQATSAPAAPTSTTNASTAMPSPIFNATSGVYSIGPYVCEANVNMSMVTAIVYGFLLDTDNNLRARTEYLAMNIHAAHSYENATLPAQAPTLEKLPPSSQALSYIFSSNLSMYLYTPSQLQAQRANLNATWLNAANNTIPDYEYYTQYLSDNILMTQNGWPSEGYIGLKEDKRVLLSFNRIDPQMANYSIQADSDTIFPPGTFNGGLPVTETPNGTVSAGCLYNANDTSISSINASWALTSSISGLGLVPQTLNFTNSTLEGVDNAVACAYSPFLNTTLSNTTPALDITPYKAFAYAAVWSWAPWEPRNSSDPLFRCAILNPAMSGRWQVDECSVRRTGACRSDANPLLWTISADKDIYSGVNDECPPQYSFAVPRTALENRYLFEAVRASSEPNASIWINFNSLAVQSCWISGVNETCPYDQDPNNDETRQIIVPSVAAFIILVLTIITLTVKCGANRQRSRRRRKGADGWDYEGVPA